MAITIQAIVLINPVQSRAYTTERDDTGISTQAMAVSGYTDRTATLTAAKEIARQLNEMAANYHYRTVYVADSEDSQYDGMYELLSAGVTATPATSNVYAALFSVNVTLRRVGGSGTSGGNAYRYVAAKATLVANDYSVTSTVYLPIPVGASFVPTTLVGGAARVGADGSMNLTASASLIPYVMTGADQAKGECKIWDTGGSAVESTWKRVYSADHTFASTTHCVIDNSLTRIRPSAASAGRHEYDAWNTNSSAWTAITDTTGDVIALSSMVGLTIDHLSPWLTIVTWICAFGSTTIYKTITLERGKHLAKVRLAANTSVSWNIGLQDTTWRWLLARNTVAAQPAQDMGFDSTTTLSRTDSFAILHTTTRNVVGIVAVATTTPVITRIAGQRGVNVAQTATAMEVYLGGVAYDTTDSWNEAESETLGAGATAVSTIAGASGAGNNQVRLNGLSQAVTFNTLQQINSTAPGTRAIFIVRVASTVAAASANAGDSLKLSIYNNTVAADGATATILATNATWFATANTWVWIEIEYAVWNGTDVIIPYVNKSAHATAQAFHIDQALLITLNGGAGVNRPRDVAHQALTDVAAWSQTLKSI